MELLQDRLLAPLPPINPSGHAHTPEDFNALFAFMEDPRAVTEGYATHP